jgi:uncharacterized protein (DUF1800 family)
MNLRSLGRFCLSLTLLASFLPETLNVSANERLANKPLSEEQRIDHVLSRLTFGARPGDTEKVKGLGVKAFIEQQLDPDSIDDTALEAKLEKLPTLSLPAFALAQLYNPPKPPVPVATPTPVNAEATATPTPAASPSPKPAPTPVPKNPGMVVGELQRAKLLRAVYSNRQLYELVVDFWENHFSINGNKDADRLLLTGFDRDAVRPFAFGRFRDLLGAVAHSPAMLFYLDNWQSSVVKKYPATKDKPERQTGGINENYARELMELHTLGVDGGYTQKDVQEVARCFTGWTIRKPNEEGAFVFNPAAHDNGEKIVLGQKIAEGGGIADGERVLDILAKHPSTARFVVTKLARRFYGDDPPPKVIDTAAQVFLRTDGSIRETLRSLITSPAFFDAATYQVKIRSPFEFVVAALRITGAETDGMRPVLDWTAKMGQPVYGRATPEGFPEHNSEWLSNNDLLARFNFAVALATNKIKGTKIEPLKLLNQPLENTRQETVNRFASLILTGRAGTHTKAVLTGIAAGNAAASGPNRASFVPAGAAMPEDFVAQIIALTLGAPEFQRK